MDPTKHAKMQAQQPSKKAQMDIISTLPRPIIEIILCFLPISEAARTSILSRKWRYTWTTIPKLSLAPSTVLERTPEIKGPSHLNRTFGMASNMNWRCKFFYAIHQVLLLRQSPIHEVTLSLTPARNCFEIDQIILHLSRNHIVKKLTLEVDFYSLPLCVFSLHHLNDLCLTNCIIKHEPTFSGFGSLTSLSFKDVRISGKTLLHLLSNCPALKRLSLPMFRGDLLGETITIMELFKCLPVIEHFTIGPTLTPVLRQSSVPKKLSTSLIHLKYVCIQVMITFDHEKSTLLPILMKCSPNLEKIKLEVNCGAGRKTKSYVLERTIFGWLEHLNDP